MSQPALLVDGLWKEYAVAHATMGAPNTLYHALGDWMRSPLQSLRRSLGPKEIQEQFWALRDVNLRVNEGEVLGIVGRNGAGKSTLLKVLSRITAPTRGRLAVRGRLASLLEVGTGFHPELTGRENIFLNGAILGMSRVQVQRSFDDIVQFAEVERFLDTPVKRYSSGMYVRLAFGVAAHLEADVLLVDEVLAVGDASFQRRCLGKMRDVAGSGRTVIFVSHNMVAVEALCSRAAYLRGGSVALDGAVESVIAAHMADSLAASRQPLAERTDRRGDGRLRFQSAWLEDETGSQVAAGTLGRALTVCLAYEARCELDDVYVAFDIREANGEAVTNCNNADVGQGFGRVLAGMGVFRCTITRLPLRAGAYTGNVFAASRNEAADFVESAFELQVEDGDFYGTGSLRENCRVMVEHQWGLTESPVAS